MTRHLLPDPLFATRPVICCPTRHLPFGAPAHLGVWRTRMSFIDFRSFRLLQNLHFVIFGAFSTTFAPDQHWSDTRANTTRHLLSDPSFAARPAFSCPTRHLPFGAPAHLGVWRTPMSFIDFRSFRVLQNLHFATDQCPPGHHQAHASLPMLT
jgi:hypothetical protein